MAFVFKAERNLDFATHENENLGPGSYNFQQKSKHSNMFIFNINPPFKSNSGRQFENETSTPGDL